jgi:hypothetical protein
VAGDVNKYLEVVATGNGNYTGTVTSAPTIAVAPIPITAIGAINGTPQVGAVLTAGALTPAGATATYQWQSATSAGGSYTVITGATSATYTPVAGDVNTFLEVVATGNGNYTGTVTSAPTIAVAPIPITAIGAINGTPQVGAVLTAGALTPAGATATYQWQSATSAGGSYTVITGATSTTYTPVAGEVNTYLEVVATGNGNYTGTVTSVPTIAVAPIPITAIGAINGTPQVGAVLTAGALTPAGATATYQWQSATSAGGSYTVITGATSATYTPVAGDLNTFLEVVATGNGGYTGAVTSAPTTAVAFIPITAIGAINGTPQVGAVLTAGDLTPAGATANYQWQSATTADGSYTVITGATSTTYTPVAGDVNKYLEVVATGTGSYTGTVTSLPTQAVAAPAKLISNLSITTQAGSHQIAILPNVPIQATIGLNLSRPANYLTMDFSKSSLQVALPNPYCYCNNQKVSVSTEIDNTNPSDPVIVINPTAPNTTFLGGSYTFDAYITEDGTSLTMESTATAQDAADTSFIDSTNAEDDLSSLSITVGTPPPLH